MDNTQTLEYQINAQINSRNNIDARKAFIYSLVVVWFKHINKDAINFYNFVSTGSKKNIDFNLPINIDFAAFTSTSTSTFAEDCATRVARLVTSTTESAEEYATRAAYSAVNAFAEEYASTAADFAKNAAVDAKSAALFAYSAAYNASSATEDALYAAEYAYNEAKNAYNAGNFAYSAIYYLIAAYIYLM